MTSVELSTIAKILDGSCSLIMFAMSSTDDVPVGIFIKNPSMNIVMSLTTGTIGSHVNVP